MKYLKAYWAIISFIIMGIISFGFYSYSFGIYTAGIEHQMDLQKISLEVVKLKTEVHEKKIVVLEKDSAVSKNDVNSMKEIQREIKGSLVRIENILLEKR